MPVTLVEVIGRSLDAYSITRQYYLHGPATEDEVYTVLSSQPAFLGAFPLSEFSAVEEDEIAGDWHGTVKWAPSNKPPPQEPNTVEYRFNFTAPSAHITQSLETILYSTATGSNVDPAAVGAPKFDGAINVVIDGGKKRVEGFDLAPPPEVFTLIFATETGFITRDYQRVVEGLVGHVNSEPFYDCPVGSLLLARVSGGKSADDAWSIEFGFSYIANATDIPVGDDIVVAEKDGHDLLWTFYDDNEDANYYDVIPRPRAAYVERIWPRADFADLDFPI